MHNQGRTELIKNFGKHFTDLTEQITLLLGDDKFPANESDLNSMVNLRSTVIRRLNDGLYTYLQDKCMRIKQSMFVHWMIEELDPPLRWPVVGKLSHDLFSSFSSFIPLKCFHMKDYLTLKYYLKVQALKRSRSSFYFWGKRIGFHFHRKN